MGELDDVIASFFPRGLSMQYRQNMSASGLIVAAIVPARPFKDSVREKIFADFDLLMQEESRGKVLSHEDYKPVLDQIRHLRRANNPRWMNAMASISTMPGSKLIGLYEIDVRDGDVQKINYHGRHFYEFQQAVVDVTYERAGDTLKRTDGRDYILLI